MTARTYKNSGTRYTPVPLSERKYMVRKPDHPQAVSFNNVWFVPFAVVAEEDRDMPETIPDDETLLHRATCGCRVCLRPGAVELWQARARARRRGRPDRALR